MIVFIISARETKSTATSCRAIGVAAVRIEPLFDVFIVTTMVAVLAKHHQTLDTLVAYCAYNLQIFIIFFFCLIDSVTLQALECLSAILVFFSKSNKLMICGPNLVIISELALVVQTAFTEKQKVLESIPLLLKNEFEIEYFYIMRRAKKVLLRT